jgi:phospho-N-acetylmuramoyl-pentapeptide-transferase
MAWWIQIIVVLIALIVSLGTGFGLVPYLHKLKFGQPIKTVNGPKWHEKKKGTPTMGGFMFIVASILASVIGYFIFRSTNVVDSTAPEVSAQGLRFLFCILYCFAFAMIGFVDDFIKVVKKHNDGLSPMQKIVLQVAASALFLLALFLTGDRNTDIDLIFVRFNIGLFYYPLMILVMIYLTNAVNLTDGVDGLCSCVSIVSMVCFTVAASYLGNHSMMLFTIAIAGALIGFLYWNLNPAKCFMGDTGSMYLGAAVTAVSIILHQHLLLVMFSIVYIAEALSVVIQVSYFKYTAKKHFKATGEKGKGKRIFKMTPIHHHFEMSGFSEYKICLTFSLTGLIFGVGGLLILTLLGR